MSFNNTATPISTPPLSSIPGTLMQSQLPTSAIFKDSLGNNIIGDILVGTGTNMYATLPVGTDGQTLTADSAQTNGVKWANSTGSVPTTVPFTNQTSVTVTHNLGRYPIVQTILSNGSMFLSSITHTNVNSFVVDMSNSLSGFIIYF